MERVTKGGNLTLSTIMETIVQVVDAYNEEVRALNEQIRDVNEERHKLEREDLIPMVPQFVSRRDEQVLRRAALRFKNKWGFSSHEQTKPAPPPSL